MQLFDRYVKKDERSEPKVKFKSSLKLRLKSSPARRYPKVKTLA